MSTPINDGGPAFPSPGLVDATDERRADRDGMTLRDYFAAAAIHAANEGAILLFKNDIIPNAGDIPPTIARMAYQVADAMIAERAKVKP